MIEMRAVSGSMCFSLKNKRLVSSKNRPGADRKPITGFSSSARRNLLQKLQSINFKLLASTGWRAYFLTLTYQYSLDSDKEDFYFTHKSLSETKNDLDKFFKKLVYFFRKKNIDIFAFWKLEFFKKAPVPHFHCILFVESSKYKQKVLKHIVSHLWSDTITYGKNISDKLKSKILSCSTNVRYTPLDLYDILQIYISKEIGKVYQTEQSNGWVGRFWGIINRSVYKRYYVEDNIDLPVNVFFKVRRLLKKYLKKKGYNVKLRGTNGIKVYYIKNIDNFNRMVDYYLKEEKSHV
jgi:hypothetical protein